MLLIAYFSILVTSYVCRFPSCKKGVVNNILVTILLVLGFYITFSKIDSVSTSISHGLVVKAQEFPLFGIRWDAIYEMVFLAGLPAISVISIFLRIEVTKNKLYRQQMILVAGVVFLGWATFFGFGYIGGSLIPSFDLLLPFGFAFEIYLLYKIVLQSVLFDIKTLFAAAVDFAINYLFLGLLAGLVYTLLHPLRVSNLVLFLVIYSAVIGVLLFAGYQIAKYLKKFRRNRTTNYIQQFEKDLASLDYTESPEILFEQIKV